MLNFIKNNSESYFILDCFLSSFASSSSVFFSTGYPTTKTPPWSLLIRFPRNKRELNEIYLIVPVLSVVSCFWCHCLLSFKQRVQRKQSDFNIDWTPFASSLGPHPPCSILHQPCFFHRKGNVRKVLISFLFPCKKKYKETNFHHVKSVSYELKWTSCTPLVVAP